MHDDVENSGFFIFLTIQILSSKIKNFQYISKNHYRSDLKKSISICIIRIIITLKGKINLKSTIENHTKAHAFKI